MEKCKDTRRALVRLAFDGRVFKTFRGHQAKERFENEIRVLRYLEEKNCQFVPKVLETKHDELTLVTTSAGTKVQHISEKKMKSLFDELEAYGVRHEDQADRNVTYLAREGRFCIIDFEFATILDDPTHVSPKPMGDEGEKDD